MPEISLSVPVALAGASERPGLPACAPPGATPAGAAPPASGRPCEGLGHALRTPLTALHGALGLLGAGVAGDLPPDAHALVSLALRNCAVLEQAVEAHLLEIGAVRTGA